MQATTGSHQETYKNNEQYTQELEGLAPSFYLKYADSLLCATKADEAKALKLLDVGCGVGTVLRRWHEAGADGYGVEVSETSMARARRVSPNAQLYDGQHLPFADKTFDGAGTFNVLEHVEQPELFIHELVRVVRPGGLVVISSPNFLRVFGFRDYHHKMRGVGNKVKNALRLRQKAKDRAFDPDVVRFDRMDAVVKTPFTPDDDAIVATNAPEIRFFLKRCGCQILASECTDRVVGDFAELVLNLGPWRDWILNAFVVGRRAESD